jgi:2-dehydro-3-deoxygalactonokinase
VVEAGTRRVLAEQSAASGIKAFAPLPAADRAAAMARFMADRLAQWPDLPATVPLIISGMASSSVGWRELPYATTPFPLDGTGCEVAHLEFPDGRGAQRSALLVSGVRTADDVLRGEECALIGAHALRPCAAGRSTLMLLAGTHPKHAWVGDGRLLSFRTHLTGELFDALSRATLLAASVDREAASGAFDPEAFREGVIRVQADGLSAALFQVRARQLLQGVASAANTWYLSGLLVGAELTEVAVGDATDMLLVGDERRVDLYRQALLALQRIPRGQPPPAIDLATAVIAGQEAILRHAPAK